MVFQENTTKGSNDIRQKYLIFNRDQANFLPSAIDDDDDAIKKQKPKQFHFERQTRALFVARKKRVSL